MKLSRTEFGRRSHSAPPMAEINIIPLVDVVLVLLIIFMATTAFVKEAGLNMKLPAAKTTEAQPPSSTDVNVALARGDKIYLNGQPSSLKLVAQAMYAGARKNPAPRVIIKGDERIEYRRVVEIMDIAKQAGLSKIMLGTELVEGGR